MTTGIRSDAAGFGALQYGGEDKLRFGSDNSGQLAGFRNRLLNGNCSIAQRGPSFVAGTTGYTLDRWKATTNSNVAISQSNLSLAETGSALKLTPSGVANSCVISQTLEKSNIHGLYDKPATFSFIANCDSGTQTVTAVIQKTSTADTSSATFSTIASVVCNVTTTPTKFTVSGVIPNDGTAEGVRVVFSTSNTADGVGIRFWNIQLEEGSIATPFEHRPIGLELALCQRYFSVMDNIYGTYVGSGYRISYEFRQEMRAAPTLSGGTLIVIGASALTITGFPFITTRGFRDVTSSSAAPAVGSELSLRDCLISAEL